MWPLRELLRLRELSVIRHTTASPSNRGHGEWSELGSRDIDHTTRGARVRERDVINQSVRWRIGYLGASRVIRYQVSGYWAEARS
jgi:hypothetical protein